MDRLSSMNFSNTSRLNSSKPAEISEKESNKSEIRIDDVVEKSNGSACEISPTLFCKNSIDISKLKSEQNTGQEPAPQAQKNEKDLTVLFYMDGQYQDLDSSLYYSMLGLESVGSDKNTNILALFGRTGEGQEGANTSWKGMRQFYVEKNPDSNWSNFLEEDNCKAIKDASGRVISNEESIIQSDPLYANKLVSPFKEVKGDMHDYKTLEQFICDGISSYPAKHYAVVIMSHGGSWQGAAMLDPKQTHQAFEGGTNKANNITGKNDHIDLAVFNSCYMGNLESANEIRNHVDVTLASENYALSSVFFDWPETLTKVQNDENSGKEFNPKKFGKDFVEMYRAKGENGGYLTLAAIDNKKLVKLTNAWEKFIKDWKKSGLSDDIIYKDMKDSKNYASPAYTRSHFDYRGLKDIGSITERVLEDPKIPKNLKDDCKDIAKALKGVLINEQHVGTGMEGSNGLSVWAPTDGGEMAFHVDKYSEYAPSFQKTGWFDKMKDDLRKLDTYKMVKFMNTMLELYEVNEELKNENIPDEIKENLKEKFAHLQAKTAEQRKGIDFTDSKNYTNNPSAETGKNDRAA